MDHDDLQGLAGGEGDAAAGDNLESAHGPAAAAGSAGYVQSHLVTTLQLGEFGYAVLREEPPGYGVWYIQKESVIIGSADPEGGADIQLGVWLLASRRRLRAARRAYRGRAAPSRAGRPDLPAALPRVLEQRRSCAPCPRPPLTTSRRRAAR